MSCVLFALIIKVQNPYDSHLFGRIKQGAVPKEEVSFYPSSTSSIDNGQGLPHSHSAIVDLETSGVVESLPGTPQSGAPSRSMSPVAPLGIYAPSSFMAEGTRINTLAAFQQLQRAASQTSHSPSRSNMSIRSQALSTVGSLNRVASASNLSLGTHAFGHRRSHSANSFQSSSMVSISSMSQYPGHFSPARMPSSASMAASAWHAIHPPRHHFRHTSNPGTLGGTPADFATIRKVPMSPSPHIGYQRPRARTSASVSSSSYSGTPHTTSWEQFPVMPPGHVASGGGRPVPYRAGSSHSSSANDAGATRAGTLKRANTGTGADSEMTRSDPVVQPAGTPREGEDDITMTSRSQASSGGSSSSGGTGSVDSFSEVVALYERGQGPDNSGGDRPGPRHSLIKSKSTSELVEGRTSAVWKGKQRAV